jgi:hypothetical protein
LKKIQKSSVFGLGLIDLECRLLQVAKQQQDFTKQLPSYLSYSQFLLDPPVDGWLCDYTTKVKKNPGLELCN